MNRVTDSIETILHEAQQDGSAGLPITFLVKFLYLLDLYVAEANEGKPHLDVEWYFHHFGPYSEQIQTAIDEHVKGRFLDKEAVEDRDFELIKLSVKARPTSLEDMELPIHAKLSIHKAIKNYRYDLTGLLNLVYFRTTPMENAIPKGVLSFENCRKNKLEDLKAIPLKSPSKKKCARIKELFSLMKENYVKETSPTYFDSPPIYDKAFFDANRNETDELEIDERITASLSFSNNDR